MANKFTKHSALKWERQLNLQVIIAIAFAMFLIAMPSVSHAALTASISPQNVNVDTGTSTNPIHTTFTFIGNGIGNPSGTTSGNATMTYNIEIISDDGSGTGGSCFITQNGFTNKESYSYTLLSNGTQTADCGSNSIIMNYANSPYNITFTATNSSQPSDSYTTKTQFFIYPNLAVNSIALSTNALDVEQQVAATVKWNLAADVNAYSGVPPYNVVLYSSTSSTSCSGSGATPVSSANDISSDSKSFTVLPTTNGNIHYCAVVTDSSYNSQETKQSNIMPLYVAGTPSIRLSVKNFSYDVSQPVKIGFSLNGGIGPFDVTLISAQNSSQVGNTLTLDSPNVSSSFTFNVPNAAGSYSYYVKAIDEETNKGGTNPYTFTSSGSPDSITYTISPTLAQPSISLNSDNVEQGQPFSAALSWTGGTEPYTANVYIYNATSNSFVTGLPGLGMSGISSDSANIPIQSNALMPGTYYLKAVVSDSSGGGSETNSSISGNFVISAAPKITETLSSNSLTYPDFPTITIAVANGISPYSATINIVNQDTGSVVESNFVSLTATNNIATYPTNVLLPGAYLANVMLTDSASPAVTVYSSDAFAINKLSPTLSLNVPSSFTYNSSNATVTGSVYPLGLTGDLIMSVNGGAGVDVAELTSKLNTLTYKAPASAGSYQFTLATDANAIYSTGSNSISYTISKATPSLHLSSIPIDFLYNGNSINTNVMYNISNTPAPLDGYLMLNGNNIAEYTPNSIGQEQSTTINAISPGDYALKFENADTGNYVASSVTDNFIISAAAANSFISVPSSFSYTGSNAIITASISPSNAIGGLYMSVNGSKYAEVASTSSGSNSIIFNAPAVPGTYAFEFYNEPNVQYAEDNVSGSYSISKAAPAMSFTKSCSSYVYDGLSCNTTASITTFGKQINASLYVNGAFIGQTSNTITYVGSNALGTYNIVFNTTGNSNYTARSISYNYTIKSRVPPPSGTSSVILPLTTIPTTTIPVTITPNSTSNNTRQLNISASQNAYSGNFGLSFGNGYNVSFGNEGIHIKFSTNLSKTIPVNFTIFNYTGTLPPLSNKTEVKAFDINFTSILNSTITAFITIPYSCSSGQPSAPYLLKNGTWSAITPFFVNSSACTVSFSIASDPVIGLFASNAAVPPSSTTVAPTTTVASTPKAPPAAANYEITALAIVVVIIVVIIAFIASKKAPKKAGSGKR